MIADAKAPASSLDTLIKQLSLSEVRLVLTKAAGDTWKLPADVAASVKPLQAMMAKTPSPFTRAKLISDSRAKAVGSCAAITEFLQKAGREPKAIVNAVADGASRCGCKGVDMNLLEGTLMLAVASPSAHGWLPVSAKAVAGLGDKATVADAAKLARSK